MRKMRFISILRILRMTNAFGSPETQRPEARDQKQKPEVKSRYSDS